MSFSIDAIALFTLPNCDRISAKSLKIQQLTKTALRKGKGKEEKEEIQTIPFTFYLPKGLNPFKDFPVRVIYTTKDSLADI